MASSHSPPILDYSTRVPVLVGVMSTGLFLCLVAVTLRFYTRIFIIHNLGADDWMALFSFVFLIISYSFLGAATTYGLGRHIETIDPITNFNPIIELTWLGFCFSPIAEAAGKVSTVLLLLRITVTKAWKYFLWSLIILSLTINTGLLLSLFTTCQPVNKLWNPMLPGHCSFETRGVILFVQGSFAAVSDLILATAPMVLLWGVKISMRSKLLLCGLLGLGTFTAVSVIFRMGFSYTLYPQEMQTDPTWDLAKLIIWKTVDPSLSVIIGCLPTLRPLFDKDKWAKGRSKTRSSNHHVPPHLNGFKMMEVRKSSQVIVQQSECVQQPSDDTPRVFKSPTITAIAQV